MLKTPALPIKFQVTPRNYIGIDRICLVCYQTIPKDGNLYFIYVNEFGPENFFYQTHTCSEACSTQYILQNMDGVGEL